VLIQVNGSHRTLECERILVFEFELLTKRDWALVAAAMVAGAGLVSLWLYWLATIA
jgi:hypothetical protein